MRSLQILLLIGCYACGQADNDKQLQGRIGSLQQKLYKTYKPGLGEFMLDIQLHHSRLWFAGKNRNRPLADFEVHKIGKRWKRLSCIVQTGLK